MNGKKSRNRVQRTKPGTNQKQVPVRIVISQADFTRMKELERSRSLSREEIFLMGLRSCTSR